MYGKARQTSRGSALEVPLVARGTPLIEVPITGDTGPSEARAHGDKLREQSWRDAHSESKTGVVASGRARPYFTSAAKQATSPVMKQRNMELFTGTLDSCMSRTGFYQKKEERAPLFDPKTNRQRVSSGGTIGNPSLTDGSLSSGDLESRFPTSQYLQNVSPVDPIRVGPGLGVSADVQATGGFQQFYRPPIENVNEYRRNNLPGRVGAGGKAAITSGQQVPNVVKNKATVEQFMDPVRPPQAGGGAHSGPAPRSAFTTDTGASTAYRPEQYAGVATGVTSAVAPSFGAPTGKQPIGAVNGVWGVNPVGDTFGVGAYTSSSISNWNTNRGDLACSPLPPAPPGPAAGGSYGAQYETHYRAPATLRSLDPGNPNQTYVGPSGTLVENQGSRGAASYVPRTTTREQLLTSNQGFVGQTGHVGQPRDHQSVEPSAHGNKRAQVLSYTPGGQKQFTAPGRETLGGIRGRGGVTEYSRLPASAAMTTDYARPGARSMPCQGGRRTSPMDNRMCGEVAAMQTNLSANPLALPAWQSGIA